MAALLNNVKASSEESSGRSRGTWARNGGQATGILEWTTATPEALRPYLAVIAERIPVDKKRSEEACTLKIDGLFVQGRRTAIVYRCSQQPATLREVLLNIGKPSGDDRRILAGIIATQVRSLHVHFQLQHMAMRTESFVFFGHAKRPDLTKPYILDWSRRSSPDMYQHPQYRVDKPLWFYQIWSLLMVLSEIAEWRPLDGEFRDKGQLLRRQQARRRLVTSPDWKGAATAELFKYGFDFLDRDRSTLEKCNHWDVKRFYDGFCELLARPLKR
ncbi:hypothetical protein HRG_005683 [Hirsutella rhossiliensis]|uniref:Protein kinase domain-containing protein n=1 Tax=Hirsutella rhossiliensis TaxID=111463 RepID=A0A9P8MVV7_9HYPO|nr:uncharacterized protein HRG_05683 [Hirsutella rhossiliensis]KAH0963173.1 hypothetical protein HRG_05683 [Hirsutella rhossiliensis]